MTLADVVNEVWISTYGGEPVQDEFALAMRIRNLAEDRNNWVFNTKTLQKAFNELEEKCKKMETISHTVGTGVAIENALATISMS